MNERRIVITGFMGSGKSSVALALGERLRCRTIDLDQMITELNQRTPAELIREHGEAAFREIETNVLQQALDDGARVIALGGGAWTIPHNRDLLAAHNCLTIWLDVPFEVCWQRISDAGGNRPLAANYDEARALFLRRRPIYKTALLRVSATSMEEAEEVARRLEHTLRAN